MTRARSAANTMVDIIAVATDNTREMIQGALWNTQHEAITGRSVRNARPAAIGWSTSKMVRALRMRLASRGSFVTTAMTLGSIVYPSCGPTHSPLLVKNVGLSSALGYDNGNDATRNQRTSMREVEGGRSRNGIYGPRHTESPDTKAQFGANACRWLRWGWVSIDL